MLLLHIDWVLYGWPLCIQDLFLLYEFGEELPFVAAVERRLGRIPMRSVLICMKIVPILCCKNDQKILYRSCAAQASKKEGKKQNAQAAKTSSSPSLDVSTTRWHSATLARHD